MSIYIPFDPEQRTVPASGTAEFIWEPESPTRVRAA